MSIKFKADKYKKTTVKKLQYIRPGRPGATEIYKDVDAPFADPSDAYANNAKMVVSFYHVPSKTTIYFKAFITAFNETYNSDWATEYVFGRSDPLYLFRQTEKRISLALKVPAGTQSEAYENLGRAQSLAQFLYPTYTDPYSATTLSQAPQVRLKVMNLLQATAKENWSLSDTENAQGYTPAQLYEYYNSSEEYDGALGVINSLVINHNLENNAIGVIEKAPNTLLPKMVEINIEFSPIHEHTLGWDEKGKSMDPLSPYGLTLKDDVPPQKPGDQGNALITANKQQGTPPDPIVDPQAPPPPINTGLKDGALSQKEKTMRKFQAGCARRGGHTVISAVKRRVDCEKSHNQSIAHYHMDQPEHLHRTPIKDPEL